MPPAGAKALTETVCPTSTGVDTAGVPGALSVGLTVSDAVELGYDPPDPADWSVTLTETV